MKNIKSFIKGFNIDPVGSTSIDAEGDVEVYNNGLRIYLQAAPRIVVTTDQTQTLTNKTMSGASNTFSNIPYSALVLTDSIVNADVNSAAGIEYSKLDLVDSIVDADINSAAAIAYSKLDLVDSIVDADINSAAAIAYSKLDLVDSIVDADINSLAAIAYSKLDLVDSIENADINSAAAIDFSKLASLTSGNILVGSAGNVATSVAMSGEATIANTGVVTLANSAVIGKVLTGFVAGAGTVAATDTILQAFQKLAGSVAGGDVTLTAFGATPNANGASISGQALTLQPADTSNPGGVSTTTQTFAGDKTFNDALLNAGEIYWEQENSSVSGANATLATPTKPIVVLQNGALTSIDGLTATAQPQIVIISNSSGNSVTINNNTGATAENRIITGTGTPLTLEHQASIFLYYSIDAEKWYVIGGSGGGSGANTTLSNLTSPTSINQHLLPDSDITRDLGSVGARFRVGHIQSLRDNANQNSYTTEDRSITDSSGDSVLWGAMRQLRSGSTVKLDWSGTDVSLNTRKLTNVSTPTASTDAANKAYVDTNIKFTTSANENISSSGSISSSTTVGLQIRRITGNAAAVTTSSTPFGSGGGWVDGTVIRLIGQSNTNTVTIPNTDSAKGAILNGDCTLGQYDSLELQYDSTADRWIEISRSIK
jgi:hypothetical protein